MVTYRQYTECISICLRQMTVFILNNNLFIFSVQVFGTNFASRSPVPFPPWGEGGVYRIRIPLIIKRKSMAQKPISLPSQGFKFIHKI